MKRSLVERYEVLPDAFSEYHLNKFNVSFKFKLISMVFSITTLLIQAKEKKSHKSGEILPGTNACNVDRVHMFPPDTVSGRESLSGQTLLPEFSLANMETCLLHEKYVMENCRWF